MDDAVELKKGLSTLPLLESALSGDPDAERQLYQGVTEELIDEARRHRLMPVLRNVTTPDDVVSEVIMRCLAAKAFESFRYQGRGSLRRYLGVILERTMVDMVRRHQSAKRQVARPPRIIGSTGDDDSEPYEPASTDPTPTSDVRTAELQRLCERVLGKREYEIWRMIEVDGRQSTEVAKELGITSSAARGLFHRARCKLIQVLSSETSFGRKPAPEGER